METYVSAERLATEIKVLLADGMMAKGMFPKDRQAIAARLKRHNVPFKEEKARGGRGGVTRLYLVAAIPGLPSELRAVFGCAAVGNAAQAGAAAARERKETTRRTAEEERIHAEHCLAKFAALPLPRQTAARAKYEVLRACGEFLTGGGYKGRIKDGRKTWHTGGVHDFVKRFKHGVIALEPWVVAEITRKGTASLGYRTLISWRDAYDAEGLYGLADKYCSKMETSLTVAQRKFVEACICEHPLISTKKLLAAIEARFAGELIPSIWAINRYVIKWKQENASRYLYLTNPDEWKNKYMFAVGDASEEVIRLNQRWEADSTPGDIMLVDGRHTIIGIIDVWPRRPRFLVSPSSKSAAIAALIRRCLLEWGTPDAIKTDNGQDYVANYLEALFRDLEIEHPLCKPFSPEEKPHIERALQTMSHGIVELLPGYIGHSVADRKAIESRKSFAKRLMTKGETVDVSLTSVELQTILDRWTDAMYMQDRHEGLNGKTPAEMVRSWTGPVKKITNERALDILLLPAATGDGTRVIGKEGIRITHGAAILDYAAVEFAGHEGERVVVKPDLADLGHAAIYLQTGEFLCWAEDPSWYGISRAEAGKHLRNKQRALVQEGAKELRKQARELKTKDIAFEILEHREQKLREENANVVELPKRAIDYTTPALEEAARAADIRENGPLVAPPPLTAEQIEARERIKADMERRATSNVIGLETESARSRYKRFRALREALSRGEDIMPDEYSALLQYEKGTEYRAISDLLNGTEHK